MKKLAVTLLSVALLAGCANTSSKKTTTNSSSSTVKLSKEDQKALDQATSEYKEFVQGQIDQLLKDTEEFQRVLKSGDLEEAKNQLLKALGSLMSRLTSVWLTMSMKTNQKKDGQASTVSNASSGNKIQPKALKNMRSNW